jgi:hypothetical protein
MSRRQEIVQRAADEVARITARFQSTRAEIIRQQRSAVASMPDAAAALDDCEQALTAAFDIYESAVSRARARRLSVEEKANDSVGAGEIAATESWRQSTDAAEAARREAIDAAGRMYEGACSDAMRVAWNLRDEKLAAARSERDAALAKAARQYHAAAQGAWLVYQEASAAAREGAIATIAAARDAEDEELRNAAAAQTAARDRAEQALAMALATEPVAAAVLEAFRLRLREAEIQCDAEKASTLEQMKRELGRI